MKQIASIQITPSQVLLNGQPIHLAARPKAEPNDGQMPVSQPSGKEMLTALYKQHVNDYPKFYKMDPLARLGFIASELLLQSVPEDHFVEREDRAIILVNKSASLVADRKYETTIQTGDDYFPSPADFVYTLPNIVTGEIAIRHHYHGETTFLILHEYDEAMVENLISQAFLDPTTTSVLGGWLECTDENHFEARLGLYEV